MTAQRVAIVDDNADNRFLLDAMLSGTYELSLFEDGPSALAGITEAPPAIVLLDISLPGMDGVEVLSHLRANDRTARIPIVAVTAHAMAGDRERFLSLGFDAYLSKPIRRAADVIETITKLAPAP